VAQHAPRSGITIGYEHEPLRGPRTEDAKGHLEGWLVDNGCHLVVVRLAALNHQRPNIAVHPRHHQLSDIVMHLRNAAGVLLEGIEHPIVCVDTSVRAVSPAS
jgi:hypothetical protein